MNQQRPQDGKRRRNRGAMLSPKLPTTLATIKSDLIKKIIARPLTSLELLKITIVNLTRLLTKIIRFYYKNVGWEKFSMSKYHQLKKSQIIDWRSFCVFAFQKDKPYWLQVMEEGKSMRRKSGWVPMTSSSSNLSANRFAQLISIVTFPLAIFTRSNDRFQTTFLHLNVILFNWTCLKEK